MKRSHIFIFFLAVLLALPATAQTPAGDRFIDAVQACADGRYEQAAPLLEALVKENPADDAAWYYLGLCRMSRRDVAGAREAFRKAADLDPGNYWYRDRLAMVSSVSGDNDATIAQYERLLADFPKKTDIQFNLVNLYLAEGRTDKAIESLDAIEGSLGKSDGSVMTRFNILRQQGDNETAYQVLRDYVDEYASPYVLTMLGDYEIGMYNDTTALAYYGEALSFDKDYAPARLGIAETYRLTRRYPEYFTSLKEIIGDADVAAPAKADYLQAVLRHTDRRFQQSFSAQLDSVFLLAVQTHPADTLTIQTAGMYYAVSERMDQAAELFRRNVELAPESLPAAATYVQVLSELKDWDGIVRMTEESYGKFPQEPAFLEMQNVALYNKKDYRGVLDNCSRLLRTADGDPARTLSALSTMGDMYWRLGEKKNAFKTYDKALKIDASYAPVLNNYAWYLCQEGTNLKKAYSMSKKTVELEPDNVTYLDTFGWILHLLKKDLEAKPFFKHAMLYGGKENRTVLLHYARVLEVLGETDLAAYYRDQADKLPEEEDE